VCLGTIGIGDRYRRQRIVDGGDAWVWKAHGLCDAAYVRAWHEFGPLYDETLDFAEEVRPYLIEFFDFALAGGNATRSPVSS